MHKIIFFLILGFAFSDSPNWDSNDDGVLDNYNSYENNGSIVSFSKKSRAFDCPSFQHHFKDIKSPYADKIAKSKQQDVQVWGGSCCNYGKEGRTYVKSVSGKKCYFATYLSNNVLLEDTVYWGE